VQGALQDPQQINVTNYGIANYPELPGLSEVYTHELSSSCADTPPTTLVSCSSIHISQCRTWSRYSRTRKCRLPRVYRPTFPEYIPNWTVPRRRTKGMTALVMLFRAWYRALLKPPLAPPFLDRRVTALLCLPNQRQRICEGLRAVACTILILRLMWSG
jgi:hypothetical protein